MSRDRRAKVIDLCEGPGNGVRIPIEPRPVSIYYEGQKYFRMDSVTRRPPGEAVGQCYLWDGYWKERLAKDVP